MAVYGADNINNSEKISALQAKQMIHAYQTAIDSLNARVAAYLQADMNRWAADTLKEWNKTHPLKK